MRVCVQFLHIVGLSFTHSLYVLGLSFILSLYILGLSFTLSFITLTNNSLIKQILKAAEAMSRGGSYGGGQSSLGYLFGSDDQPSAPPTVPKVEPPYGIETDAEKPPDVATRPPSGKQKQEASNSNNYQRAQSQNLGNFVTVST